MISKTHFVKLAEAYKNQWEYENKVDRYVRKTAKQFGNDADFLGLSTNCTKLMDAVLDVLGVDFAYYCFDCNGDFAKFSRNITFKDGTHPEVRNLEDLYDFAVNEGSIK